VLLPVAVPAADTELTGYGYRCQQAQRARLAIQSSVDHRFAVASPVEAAAAAAAAAVAAVVMRMLVAADDLTGAVLPADWQRTFRRQPKPLES